MDMSGLSSAEQAQMVQIIEKKQMRDFMNLYSSLVERCFTSCCNDFTSRALSSKEEGCLKNCAEKFMKYSERAGARFAEENAEQMQKQQQK
ncbi:putative TIM9-translocase of the mitochondrial inner membrane [Vararia minispora EC-137]|uniref:TIM9-translocase of the mitochondrial inner membrane n=1 Tax=Vararia minispora EC-137 TaxID=1314806 RepID=A0ACB8QTI3_9AGAM|nr:putative TIM9-translocase of the mitochondrial inner membrane [Vararia minispora EC-137]